MATRSRGRDDLEGRRVRVEVPGDKFRGVVRRDYYERGTRRLLVEDVYGHDRVVWIGRPSVSVEVGGGASRTRGLQDELREAYRQERRDGGPA